MGHILVSQTLRMFVIRKCVGYTGAMAAMAAALGMAMSAQAAVAAVPSSTFSDQPTVAQEAPSAECAAAIQAIRAVVAADASEDASERAVAKTNPELAVDPSEDASEGANLQTLFTAARDACATGIKKTMPMPGSTTFGSGPSAACIAAIQQLKAAWAQGRRTNPAQLRALQQLLEAARVACGAPVGWPPS